MCDKGLGKRNKRIANTGVRGRGNMQVEPVLFAKKQAFCVDSLPTIANASILFHYWPIFYFDHMT